MDSPRTIEIHAALQADTYGNGDPKTVAWLVNRTAQVNGIRVDVETKIDLVSEKAYQRQTVNNPNLGNNPTGSPDYSLTCYGAKGKIVPHLPTSYDANGRAERLYDVVHDRAQELEAVLNQLDRSLGIQHGSEIRFTGIDGKIQSYPNQLALLLNLANKIEKIQYVSDRMLNVALVTGNEVRELYPGIGIPVTQKSLQLNDTTTGKAISLPYVGYQKNQPSIAKSLTTLAINIAVILGVLMPKKQAPSRNPFNKFK